MPGLVEIVRCEGPIVSTRLLQTYVRAAGWHRVGPEMRRALLAAVSQARGDGLLEVRQELPRSYDRAFDVVRLVGTDEVRPRSRGDRTFHEIPPSEVGYLMRILQRDRPDASREELFRMTLSSLELTRLTGGVQAALEAIYGRYCENWERESPTSGVRPTVRDSDGDPAPTLDPRPTLGSLPRSPITAGGLALLERELNELTNAIRMGATDGRGPEGSTAFRQEAIHDRIAALNKAIEDATVMSAPSDATYVRFGSTVRVRTVGGDATFVVVGRLEASLPDGRLNVMSPLGRALYGRSAGDTVVVEAPGETYEAVILTIERAGHGTDA